MFPLESNKIYNTSWYEISLENIKSFESEEISSIDEYKNIVGKYMRDEGLSEHHPSNRNYNITLISVEAFQKVEIETGDILIQGLAFPLESYGFVGIFSSDGQLKYAFIDGHFKNYSYHGTEIKVTPGREIKCYETHLCSVQVDYSVGNEEFTLSPSQEFTPNKRLFDSLTLLKSLNYEQGYEDTFILNVLVPSVSYVINFSEPTENTCTDSDGGLNYYNKGIVTFFGEEGGREMPDFCDNDGLLHEYYCLDTEGYYSVQKYVCPNRCKNGACVEYIQPKEYICTDSDGINYYMKGYVTINTYNNNSAKRYDYCIENPRFGNEILDQQENKVDECSGEDCFLLERSCKNDTLYNIGYRCPDKCSDGVCINLYIPEQDEDKNHDSENGTDSNETQEDVRIINETEEDNHNHENEINLNETQDENSEDTKIRFFPKIIKWFKNLFGVN